MAILDNIEVRVVLKDNQEVLQEYNKPDSTMADEPHSIEKYIEAKTGQDFEVQVFIKEDFKCGPGWGIGIGIKIDGGVVDYCYYLTNARVEEFKKLMKPAIFRSVRHTEGSLHSRIGFRFGSLTIDEDIDVAPDVLDGQAADLGTIRIWISKVDRKCLPRARPLGSHYNPLETTDVVKELVKDKHVGSVLQPGEKIPARDHGMEYYKYKSVHGCPKTNFLFRYRSEMDLRLLHCISGSPSPDDFSPAEERRSCATTVEDKDQAQTGLATAVTEVPVPPFALAQTSAKRTQTEIPIEAPNVVSRDTVSSSGNDDRDQKFVRLERMFKESQEQLQRSQERTAAMIQSFMGGFGHMVQAFAASTSTAPAASPTLQLPAVKRESVKEEEDTENGKVSGGLGRRPVKRIKTIIELD
ncbi:MAG: hypothetical protein Q9172_004867 [Xanthocarpia lactea]